MSKYSIFPDSIKELLEADAKGRNDWCKRRQVHTKNTAKQYRYEARERVKQALADIQWYAETQHRKQCEQVFDDQRAIRDLIKSILHATNYGSLPYDNKAFKIAHYILKAVHASLNEILDQDMIRRVKLSHPEITRRRYSNIAALELILTLYL